MSSFCLLFVPPKRSKTVFFGLQKHRFYPPKDDVLHSKSIAFVAQNLCFGKISTDFSPFYPLFFSGLEK